MFLVYLKKKLLNISNYFSMELFFNQSYCKSCEIVKEFEFLSWMSECGCLSVCVHVCISVFICYKIRLNEVFSFPLPTSWKAALEFDVVYADFQMKSQMQNIMQCFNANTYQTKTCSIALNFYHKHISGSIN